MNRRLFVEILIHAFAAATVLVLPTALAGQTLFRSTQTTKFAIAVIFAAAYFVCAMLLLAFQTPTARMKALRVGVAGLAAFGAAFMLLAIAQWRLPAGFAGTSPLVSFGSSILGLTLLVALFTVRGVTAGKLLVLAVAAIAGTVVQVQKSGGSLATPAREIAYVDSSLYALKATTYRNWIEYGTSRGGAIAAYRDGFVVADGEGRLYFIRETDNGALDVKKLSHQVPINILEFERGAEQVLGAKWRGRGRDIWFNLRVGDLQFQTRPEESFRLFVSHHYWKVGDACAVVRVSVLEGNHGELLSSDHLEWRTLYESNPCLTLNTGGRGIVFGALQIGGAMGLISDTELLLAVGDHEFDGWNRSPALPQDPESPYGKVILIHIDSGKSEIYSVGHRNPQGMFVDASGQVWATEHGPRGGDELNHVRRGANYGWPLVTYGTEYGIHHWPLNSTPGRHDEFEKPVLSFVPALAPTGLTGIVGRKFGAWQGDLLIGSLDGQLRRVRIEDGHSVVDEPIRIGTRIRDIAEGADGKVVLWTDSRELKFIEPAGTGDGEALVFQCTGCHTIQSWEKSSIGPNLMGVVDRRVAAEDDFGYSSAMKDFGGRWTKERLDSFLADPAGTIPGTTMAFPGMRDASERKQLINHLERHAKK